MRTLVTVALATVLAVGCATDSGERRRPSDFSGWSDEPRTIGVAGAGELPEAVLLADEKHIARDALVGAGRGALTGAWISLYAGCVLPFTSSNRESDALHPILCVIGIAAIPYAAAIGSVVGGVSGAAGSEPAETPYPLEEMQRASTLLQGTLERHDAGNMLITALMDRVDAEVPHEIYRDPLAETLAAQASFEELHDTLARDDIDALLVVRFTAIGFRQYAEPETEVSDPELAFTMSARASVYFAVDECLKAAMFSTSGYLGPAYRLSRLEVDGGSLAYRELRNATASVAGGLVHRVFGFGKPDQEKLLFVHGSQYFGQDPQMARSRMTQPEC